MRLAVERSSQRSVVADVRPATSSSGGRIVGHRADSIAAAGETRSNRSAASRPADPTRKPRRAASRGPPGAAIGAPRSRDRRRRDPASQRGSALSPGRSGTLARIGADADRDDVGRVAVVGQDRPVGPRGLDERAAGRVSVASGTRPIRGRRGRLLDWRPAAAAEPGAERQDRPVRTSSIGRPRRRPRRGPPARRPALRGPRRREPARADRRSRRARRAG